VLGFWSSVMVERSEYAQPIRRVYPLWMQDQGGRDMTQAVSDTPRTDAVLSSDHYAKDLLELARTLERELAALREGVPRDAARYMWLRSQDAWPSSNDPARATRFDDKGDLIFLSGDKLDAAIDAALAQEGTPTGRALTPTEDAIMDRALRKSAKPVTPTGSEP
jgi:hypothetical protein